MEDAVDPVADLEFVLEGLDVDVGGAALDGPVDHHVDEADDRRLAREVAQVVNVLLVLGEVFDEPLGVAAARATLDSLAVAGVERLGDILLLGEQRFDAQPGRDLEPLHRVAVARIGHRDLHHAVGGRNRQHLGVAQELDVQPGNLHRVVREFLAAGERHAEHLAVDRQEVVLGNETQVEEQALDALAALALEFADLAQILQAHPAPVDENLLEGLRCWRCLRLHRRFPGRAATTRGGG